MRRRTHVRSSLRPTLLLPALFATIISAATIKIMPLGDSITLGQGSPSRSSYRAFLWRSLREAGFSVDFVGPFCNGPSDVDCHHAGYDGWYIADDSIGGQRRNGVLRFVPSLMTTYRPDIILLFLGTNDLLWLPDSAKAVTGLRMDAFIDSVFHYLPNVKIVVASALPFNGQAFEVHSQRFREHLRTRCTRSPGKLFFADMYPAFPNPLESAARREAWLSLIPDGIHPNDSGYRVMSTVWFPILRNILTPLSASSRGDGMRVVNEPASVPRRLLLGQSIGSAESVDAAGRRTASSSARKGPIIDFRITPSEN